jgi:hypothetical protein
MHGPTPDPKNYRTIPALAAYIDRVGAEQQNFKRFVIKEQGASGYHRIKVRIKIDNNNKIECDSEDYQPTEDEAAAIAKAIGEITNWPRTIPTTQGHVRKLRQRLGQDAVLFTFLDESGDKVLFVQQRVVDQNGGKADLPWTFCSDGNWYNMEPDGELPLFGLEQLRTAATVFLHEGAKKAWHMGQLFTNFDKREEKKRHPWTEDLFFLGTAHLAWPGGAYRYNDVDWGPIRRLAKHVNVIVVCDHDQVGEEAAVAISRLLKRKLLKLRFGEAFPPGFDLADEFPKDLFEEKSGRLVYKRTSPRFSDCTSPATWATNGEKNKAYLREEFKAEWIAVVSPTVFIHRSRLERRYLPAEFNALVAPYSDATDTAKLLSKSQWAQAEGLAYEPGQKPGLISFEGRQVVNVYQPSPIVPLKGDCGPFLEFMSYLIPEEKEREDVLRWSATLVARPDVKMSYGLLLISETQGVGKTTLTRILTRLVGMPNCSFPDMDEVDGKFNSWRAFKRLVVVAELYSGHSDKTYNKLKNVVTDEDTHVENKYEKPFYVNNHAQMVVMSNSMKALKLDDRDRRWHVPRVTEETQPPEYWRSLNDWLQEDGLAKIAHWARDYVTKHGHVEKGLHAPASERKREVAAANMSEGQQLAAELGDLLKNLAEHRVMRLDKVRTWWPARSQASCPNMGMVGQGWRAQKLSPRSCAGAA